MTLFLGEIAVSTERTTYTPQRMSRYKPQDYV